MTDDYYGNLPIPIFFKTRHQVPIFPPHLSTWIHQQSQSREIKEKDDQHLQFKLRKQNSISILPQCQTHTFSVVLHIQKMRVLYNTRSSSQTSVDFFKVVRARQNYVRLNLLQSLLLCYSVSFQQYNYEVEFCDNVISAKKVHIKENQNNIFLLKTILVANKMSV